MVDNSYSLVLGRSYGNDTKLCRDSDVDIVICLNQSYYSDTNLLQPGAKATYDCPFSRATYGYTDFKADVFAWLQKKFGADVRLGKKAIFIKADGNRRDADVLVCAQHRRYRAASGGVVTQYDEGSVFWTSAGTEIVNFAKQHSENCTNKHQNTNQRIKRIVRI